MDILSVLEQKVASLVKLIRDLQDKSEILQVERDALLTDVAVLSARNEELKLENAKLAEENAQLLAKLDGLEGSVFESHGHIVELNKEKVLTKMVVDDLIKSINDLVGNEIQQ
jgi:predicted nuclease with TOPRIM domain